MMTASAPGNWHADLGVGVQYSALSSTDNTPNKYISRKAAMQLFFVVGKYSAWKTLATLKTISLNATYLYRLWQRGRENRFKTAEIRKKLTQITVIPFSIIQRGQYKDHPKLFQSPVERLVL